MMMNRSARDVGLTGPWSGRSGKPASKIARWSDLTGPWSSTVRKTSEQKVLAGPDLIFRIGSARALTMGARENQNLTRTGHAGLENQRAKLARWFDLTGTGPARPGMVRLPPKTSEQNLLAGPTCPVSVSSVRKKQKTASTGCFPEPA
ncbi:hypothetical protein TIFTF001_028612 [Ficus carica]|uniref:Uncharacterized protein n=1 Tax=Ficus carica TaxID=3494 RepID=A0AA88J210_FICCA|nr:hypothetical protein TIFTF001_028612 [Ficus carica]